MIKLTNIFISFHSIILLNCGLFFFAQWCTMHYDCNISINISFYNSLTYVFMVYDLHFHGSCALTSAALGTSSWRGWRTGMGGPIFWWPLWYFSVCPQQNCNKKSKHITIFPISCIAQRECSACNSEWNTIKLSCMHCNKVATETRISHRATDLQQD